MTQITYEQGSNQIFRVIIKTTKFLIKYGIKVVQTIERNLKFLIIKKLNIDLFFGKLYLEQLWHLLYYVYLAFNLSPTLYNTFITKKKEFVIEIAGSTVYN